MAALTMFLLIVSLHLVVSADQIITAKPGKNTILPCRSADSRPAVFVEWRRTDLESGHVLMFKDDQIYSDDQLPSFKDRVDLQDRQMKDGDLSLVLKNVATTDNGTYVCRDEFSQSKRRKRSVDPISTVRLQVSPPGDKKGQTGDNGGLQDGTSAGQTGLIVGLVVPALIVLMIPAVIVIIVRRRLPLYHPPHNEAEPGPP